MEKYVVGIDIGTTGLKSLLLSESGEVVSFAYRAYPTRTPQAGWCEQNANDWWTALVATLREVVCEPRRASGVVAISLSTQGGTLVPVGQNGRPTYHAIVWSDTRCDDESRDFCKEFGESFMYQHTGWHVQKGLNALQIARLRRNMPDVFQATDMFLSVPDYISLRMTGRAAIDLSNAGINQLMNLHTRDYDASIMHFAGIRDSQLPSLVPSCEIIGCLLPDVAEELGLPRNVLLVSGAHDQYAALLGSGLTEAGEILVGSGTAWVVTALSESPDFQSGFSQSISATGSWGSLVSLSSGGVCLDWFRSDIATADGNHTLSYDDIEKMNALRAQNQGAPFFLPYFAGSPYPNRNPNAKASLLGLDLSHSRFDISYAIMEGIAIQIAWILESFSQAPRANSLMFVGGASKSPFWTQMLANITQLNIKTPVMRDRACVGAAIMAGIGSRLFPTAKEAIQRIDSEFGVSCPQAESIAYYAERKAEFKRLAQQLTM